MSAWPLRFVHASDFHLEQVPRGLAEVPDHLRAVLVDCPYQAAERVFDTVLSERAHLLVLSGDVVDPQQAGPRAVVFLLEQFERLARQNVAIYWTSGAVDAPQRWPASVELPENVHRFTPGQVDQFVFHHEQQPVALVAGTGDAGRGAVAPGRFAADPTGLFTLAVAYGCVEPEALKQQKVHYLALGGVHKRKSLGTGELSSHYPGTPQGRSFDESGSHGCTVGEVDESLRVRTRFVPTDVLRWSREHVEITPATERKELEELLRARVEAAIDSASGRELLIRWTLAGSGDLIRQLRQGGLAGELLGWLRGEYGSRRPAAWSTAIEVMPGGSLPRELYEQDTILGDFLRLVEQYQNDPSLPIQLDAILADQHAAGQIGAAVALTQKEDRQRVLREVAMLGADLLGADGSEDERIG